MRMLSNAAIFSLVVLCASALPARAADTDVNQHGIHFSNPSVTLKVGDTVRFHNQDDVTHNIMVIDSDDNAEDQGLQKPGVTIVKKFDQAGTFEVRCAIHPKMKMMVTVEH